MKALQINEYGGVSTLQTVAIEKPSFGTNQVLIKIRASAVNPVDAKIRAGYLAQIMPKTFPLILGWEASGIIEAIGSDVENLKIGDEVYTMPNMGQGGTYAEYVAVNANEVALKPKTISHLQAAAVPMGASTAYTCIIKVAAIHSGQKILIHGAAGAVGYFAVQMAKLNGAYVIGTATGEGIDLLKSIGADEVIDYATTDFATIVKDVDVVLDLVGGEAQTKSFAVLKKNGLLLSTVTPPSPEKATEFGVNAQFVFTQPDAAMLTQLAHWIDEGKLKTQQPTVLSLDQAQQAHEMIENRTAKRKLVFQL